MNENRIGAAYHEAGHAVIAWVLGLEPAKIEIGIDGDESAGKTMVGSDEHLPELDRLAICYAGMVAQEIFECPTHENAGVSDYAKMIEILGDEISEEESLERRNAAYARAREILLANKAKIERLALHLVDKVHISGSNFLELINAS
jgi:ATP-dependent Zn protease